MHLSLQTLHPSLQSPYPLYRPEYEGETDSPTQLGASLFGSTN
jgi:hypothetical protein